MGFFKEFKEDFADAVDELIPGGEEMDTEEDDMVVDTIDHDIDVDSELSKLDGLLEQVEKKVNEPEKTAPKAAVQESAPVQENYTNKNNQILEDTLEMDMNEMKQQSTAAPERVAAPQVPTPAPASDENAVITSGMTITGNLESTGSIDVEGLINGNVTCNGKLTVTGTINGDSTSAEFFADSAKIAGEVVSSGTVKIGVGSVVIGNISASSAVIAGAVKGDIDVQGPVVVDTSAVVMGNIKSRSVQINNGAVIEGFCSQAYAEVDVEKVFG